MEEGRKKLRMCLICVVMAAVIIGLIYYFSTLRVEEQMNDGTLVERKIYIDNDKLLYALAEAGYEYE